MPDGNGSNSRSVQDQLNRWWHEHSQLDLLVAALADSLGQEDAPGCLSALDDLSEVLETHIRIEEETYFPMIEQLYRSGGSMLQDAREGHGSLIAAIDELRSLLGKPASIAAARVALSNLLEGFRIHEEVESRLVSDLRQRLSGD